MNKILFILLIIPYCCYSQEKSVHEMIKSYDAEKERQLEESKRRTEIDKEYSLKHEQKLGIDPVEDNNNEYTFRLSFFNTFITLYKYNGQVFGDIKLVAKNHDDYPDGELFKMTYNIPHQQVDQVLKLIDSTAVDTIPSEAYIKGWGQGFDGIGYTLEQKTDSAYTYKCYWSPRLFKELPQAVAIEQFTDKLLEIIEYKNLYNDFEARIPFDSYSTGSYYTVTKILTWEEYRQKKREARRRKRKK